MSRYREQRERGAGPLPAFILTASWLWLVPALAVAFLSIPACGVVPKPEPFQRYHYAR